MSSIYFLGSAIGPASVLLTILNIPPNYVVNDLPPAYPAVFGEFFYTFHSARVNTAHEVNSGSCALRIISGSASHCSSPFSLIFFVYVDSSPSCR